MANIYIGKFLSITYNQEKALFHYYKARDILFASVHSEKKRFYYQSIINGYISDLYSEFDSNFSKSISKKQISSQVDFAKLSHDYEAFTEEYLRAISDVLKDMKYLKDSSNFNLIFSYIRYVYDNVYNIKQSTDLIDYYILKCIGQCLAIVDKPILANKYLYEALDLAFIVDSERDYIDIITLCANQSLENKEIAQAKFLYQAADEMCKYRNDFWMSGILKLRQARSFYFLNDFRECLNILNHCQFVYNTKKLTSNQERKILYWIYNAKSFALEHLKMDSIDFYKYKALQEENYLLNSSAHLKLEEQDYLLDWIDKLKQGELNLSEQLSRVRENEQKLKTDTANRNLAKTQDELVSSREVEAATRKAAESEIQKRIAEQKIHEIQTRNNWIVAVSIIGFILLATGVAYYVIRNNQKLKESKYREEFTRLQNQKLQIDNLAKNKIHNFRSDITDIDLLTHKGGKELKAFMAAYKKFLRIYADNWSKGETLTLADELREYESYKEVQQVLKPVDYIEHITLEPEELDRCRFIQSAFSTVLHNSIIRGFAHVHEKCTFLVRLRKTQNGMLLCEIYDNGIPPVNESMYLQREGSGLNILKERVDNFYASLGLKNPGDGFEVSISDNRTGTYVKIYLPYAEVENSNG